MKLLSGAELVGFIKERQAHEVRSLKQSKEIIPSLAIVITSDNQVIETYVKLKQEYAEDILIKTRVVKTNMSELSNVINNLNNEESVKGIILQLPLANPDETDKYVTQINPEKDVDALGSDEYFTPATAMAIDWLVNGYNVNLNEKKIAIVGSEGRLVGKPLMKLWSESNPTGFDIKSNLNDLRNFDLVVSATGQPGLIKSDMINAGCVFIDAGAASEGGKIVGDADPELRKRDDLTITPEKGGVGPLTIAALFDNVIRASSIKK